MSWHSSIATNRFGLGALPAELAVVSRHQQGAQGWLLAQLERAGDLPRSLKKHARATELVPALVALRDLKRAESKQDSASKKSKKQALRELRQIYQSQITARLHWSIETPDSFSERLVHFWSNHFAVSVDKPQVLTLAYSLEQEAIRPNISGQFADMLLAAVRHPAMLLYLDNAQSVGPNSRFAQQRKRKQADISKGLNENLAREILELHTLGVDGGYVQDDVQALAKALTGWSFVGPKTRRRLLNRSKLGEFQFYEITHEPGPVSLMGKLYRKDGASQAEQILRDLAMHPSTARFISAKLARHFVADQPSSRVVDALTHSYLHSGGNLQAVYRTLVALPEVWQQPLGKYKTPYDFVVSTFRSLGLPRLDKLEKISQSLTLLGQPSYRPGSPAGWPDSAERWNSPAALMRRLEWTQTLAEKVGPYVTPLDIAKQSLGPVLTEHTRLWLSRAESQTQALVLLLMSPEFQQR